MGDRETGPAVAPQPTPRAGHGPVRVLLLAMVFALVIGTGGFVASRTVARNRSLIAPMCIDSGCTSAMSADSSSSMAMPSATQARQSGRVVVQSSALTQLIDEIQRLLRLR